MRRFRVPTIPNMGFRSPQGESPQLQTSNSEIFADAEEESPNPEKRPFGPHMSTLRRRKHTSRDERYEDASRTVSPAQKAPSTTTKLNALTSLGPVGEASSTVTSETHLHEGDDGHALQHKEERILPAKKEKYTYKEIGSESAKPSLEQNVSFTDNKIDETPTGSRKQPSLTLSSQQDLRTLVAARRHRVVDLTLPLQKAIAVANRFCLRLVEETGPTLKTTIQQGLARLIMSLFTFFNFLKHLFLISLEYFAKKVATRNAIQTEGQTSSSSSSLEASIKHVEVMKETISPHNREKETKSTSSKDMNDSKLVVDQDAHDVLAAVQEEKDLVTSTSQMSEEMVTTVPRMHLPAHPSGYSYAGNGVEGDRLDETNPSTTAFTLNEGTNANHYSNDAIVPNKIPHVNSSSSGPSAGALSQDRNSAEDLINELDRNSMRFVHRDSEILLSPLDSASPMFSSNGPFGMDDMNIGDNTNLGIGVVRGPRRLSTEANQIIRLSGRRRNSRGPTGKLRSDVRTMKDSLFRVFGRNKIEPETRFASPRSARKTLAMVADMLVKEHRCDVAVRRNGALKMRCEKALTGNQRLRIRFAFQAMDAFSCSVIVCRSREDDLQVSTTDYVAFVADVQRSFLNAMSEGMHGSGSS